MTNKSYQPMPELKRIETKLAPPPACLERAVEDQLRSDLALAKDRIKMLREALQWMANHHTNLSLLARMALETDQEKEGK